jgi:hypothetical protein
MCRNEKTPYLNKIIISSRYKLLYVTLKCNMPRCVMANMLWCIIFSWLPCTSQFCYPCPYSEWAGMRELQPNQPLPRCRNLSGQQRPCISEMGLYFTGKILRCDLRRNERLGVMCVYYVSTVSTHTVTSVNVPTQKIVGLDNRGLRKTGQPVECNISERSPWIRLIQQ